MANVLIVDDDRDGASASRMLLESAGYQTRIGYDGEEGLASLSTGALPDCVLLDVDMPRLNGPGMALQMSINDRGQEKIPIVLVSGRGDLAALAARIGTPYFLLKACANYGDALLGLLERALRERHAPAPA